MAEHAPVGIQEEGHFSVGGTGDVGFLVRFFRKMEEILHFVSCKQELNLLQEFVDRPDLFGAHRCVWFTFGPGFYDFCMTDQDVVQKFDMIFDCFVLLNQENHFLVFQFFPKFVEGCCFSGEFLFFSVEGLLFFFQFADLHFAGFSFVFGWSLENMLFWGDCCLLFLFRLTGIGLFVVLRLCGSLVCRLLCFV